MVVYCCPDLIFATKIRATAQALGVVSRPARDEKAMGNRLAQVDDGRANDPVTAVIVDMDLGDSGLALIRQTKAHDPNLPVLAYGSHVAVELLQAARDAGADAVLSRGQFTSELPAILERFGSSAV